ncbi:MULTISPECIES: ABC transporter ATP-binding protein [Rhodomicrobium]|uniref:ABC transporter ATP-binding protein n=1 Tax=Rhodomicrobium TaxID=1068 RepID=UPI000B4B36DF|nr:MULTISPECIES: ABC transporter ATP-binding protein [Rhodomicrobium]
MRPSSLFEIFLPRSDLSIIKRLVLDKWRKYAPLYVVAFALMFVVAGATALSAWMMKDVVNLIFVEREGSALMWLPAVVVGVFTAKGIASYFQEVLMARIGNAMVAETQTQMFNHLLGQDLTFYQRFASSELITRITHNAQATREAVNLLATSLGRDLVTLVGLVSVMVVQQPMMFAICALGAPIGIYMQKKLVRRIRSVSQREVLSYGNIVSTMRETAQGIRVVKSFTLESAMSARMNESIGAVERVSNKIVSVNARVNPMIDTLGGFAVAGVIFYAGWRSLTYNETPGEFFSFITALLMAYEPARRLARLQVRLSQACIGVQMMYELIDTKPSMIEKPGAPALKIPRGQIRFDGVTFGYAANAPVLRDLTLEAEAGKTTALVGLSGSGKTTIMNLILRFWDPAEGAISIDGQNIADVTMHSLRAQISLVSQDVFLFDGTIRQNIAAGVGDPSDEAVIAAAKAAYAHHFILGLPAGYDTQVGELGNQLSGGQRQRISIARAFLKNAPIILLDEPTSALDSESEQAIQRALAQLTERRTTIVIAHRLATVLNADRIQVIDHGRLAESGTHRELLGQGGLYSRLYDIQFAQGDREAV